jgi:DNA-directed RNA polymerase specialized sigma24 family protein
MAALKEEVSLLKAARNVSPQYGEAVTLAQKGMAPQQIAERCGISVAEAEMVCALSRKQSE